MFNGIKNAIKTTLAIWKERPHMQEYFRTKALPHEYYAVKPHLEGRWNPVIVWLFRKVGKDASDIEFRVNTLELAESFEPCSPFEAIGSIK
jgi:hypothetical protein